MKSADPPGDGDRARSDVGVMVTARPALIGADAEAAAETTPDSVWAR